MSVLNLRHWTAVSHNRRSPNAQNECIWLRVSTLTSSAPTSIILAARAEWRGDWVIPDYSEGLRLQVSVFLLASELRVLPSLKKDAIAL